MVMTKKSITKLNDDDEVENDDNDEVNKCKRNMKNEAQGQKEFC